MTKALVLEENNRIIELYKKIFEQKNYQVDFVPDMDSCIGRIQNHQYDFVILEKSINVQQDGTNLEDIIRNIKHQQKVFFLSPYISPRDTQFEAVKDTLDLIDKPFALICLLSSLEINPSFEHNILS